MHCEFECESNSNRDIQLIVLQYCEAIGILRMTLIRRCVFPVLVMILVSGCGTGNHLVSIQVVPVDPNLLAGGIVYVQPGTTVQYRIQGWYSNRTVQSIAATQGVWTSSNPSVATVSTDGIATTLGPGGVTTITVAVNGRSATTILSVS